MNVNVFGGLFGIFRGGGIVLALRKGNAVAGFMVGGVAVTAICGAVYGLAMGIGIDFDTAIKDAIKVPAVLLMSLFLSIPVFFLAYRLLGREESLGQVAVAALACILSCSLILGVAAPVVFLYGVASGFAPELLYVHIAIVDVALLLGIFILGNLVYQAFITDRQRLVVPNVVGVIMMVLVAVVSVNFFSPFLHPSPTFSEGTDRLLDSLGVGVNQKVENALRTASLSDRMQYHYRLSLPSEGTERDFTVVRAGENYQVTIRRLVRPGQPNLTDRRVWLVDGKAYADFSGQATEISRSEVAEFVDDALPARAFALKQAAEVSYRARLEDADGRRYYVARGATKDWQVAVFWDARTREVARLEVSDKTAPALVGTRVTDIQTSTLTSASLQTSLVRAMEDIKNPSDPRFREAWETQVVIASLERPDTASFDYINSNEFFALRYPRNWKQQPWDAGHRSVAFEECAESRCGHMNVAVSSLERNKRLDDMLIELRNQLTSQTRNRDVTVRVETLRGTQVGVIEHTYDYFEGGRLLSTRRVQYWYPGRISRYSLTGEAPASDFESYRALFGSAAQSFEYLR